MDSTIEVDTFIPWYDDIFAKITVVDERAGKPRRPSYIVHLRNGLLGIAAACSVFTYSQSHVGAVIVDRPPSVTEAARTGPADGVPDGVEDNPDLLTEALLDVAPGDRMLSYLVAAPRIVSIDDVDLEALEA